MRRHSNSSTENLHPFLKMIFGCYVFKLREEYPGRKIRNAAVFASAIERLNASGYIELVDARTGIRKGIPEFLIDSIILIDSIKRAKRKPIWIPSRNFPLDLFDLDKEMQPYLSGDAILWRHIPSEYSRIDQIENPTMLQESWRGAS